MEKKVENGIFADDGSKIDKAKEKKDIKTKYTVIGFIIGALTALVALGLYLL